MWSPLWCFVLKKLFKVNRYPACEKPRNYCEHYNPIWWNQTNFQKSSWMSTLIAWRIIRDNSCFLPKKKGELLQDDFSWALAKLKSRLAPPPRKAWLHIIYSTSSLLRQRTSQPMKRFSNRVLSTFSCSSCWGRVWPRCLSCLLSAVGRGALQGLTRMKFPDWFLAAGSQVKQDWSVKEAFADLKEDFSMQAATRS